MSISSFVSRFTPKSKGQTFILTWPGDDEVRVKWNGEVVTIPPHDQIAKTGAKFRPPVDESGRPIPGAVAVSDIYVNRPGHGRKKQFDAELWCQGVSDSKGVLMERGLYIIEDQKDIEAAKKEGRPKWERAKVRQALETLRSEAVRQQELKARGLPPVAPQNYERILDAAQVVKKSRERDGAIVSLESIQALLGEAGPQTVDVGSEKPVSEDRAKTAREMAKRAGLTLKKAELEALLDGDENTIGNVIARAEVELNKAAVA